MSVQIRSLIAGVLTATLVVTGVGSQPAGAADSPSTLTFAVATHDPVVIRWPQPDGTGWIDRMDLGINLIAGASPFEVRAKRRNYATPVVAQQIISGRATDLPAGFFTSFGGFEDFTTISIRDEAGAPVREYTTDWCPNSPFSARTRPDAPPTSAYPQYCGRDNPFLLGTVWGIQAGWSSPISSVPRDEEWAFDIQPGRYQVDVTLNQKYRAWLGVRDTQATVRQTLTVVDYGTGAAVRQQAPPARDREHSHEGDPDDQVSAYDPRLRPAARVPATLAAPPARGPKPDLRALPAWNILLEQQDGEEHVTFAATAWNAGSSPLVVDGFRRTGTDLMDAYQYFYDDAGKEVGAVPAGTLEWDKRDGHLHWHFTDFAQYNLLGADKSQVLRSGKEAFCLVSTDPVDLTLPHANWRPNNTDLASSCGANTAVAVREVLDAGHGDTYYQYLPGQSLEVTDLPNGTYYIQILTNPEKKLVETTTANNDSLRKIVLGGTPGNRTLRVPPVHGIDG